MKKVTYLLVVMLSLVVVTASCTKKDDVVPPVQSLNISFDGQAAPVVGGIPTLTITVDNTGKAGEINQHVPQIPADYWDSFNVIEVNGDVLTLKSQNRVVLTGTFTTSGDKILSLKTSGLANNEYMATYTAK